MIYTREVCHRLETPVEQIMHSLKIERNERNLGQRFSDFPLDWKYTKILILSLPLGRHFPYSTCMMNASISYLCSDHHCRSLDDV